METRCNTPLAPGQGGATVSAETDVGPCLPRGHCALAEPLAPPLAPHTEAGRKSCAGTTRLSPDADKVWGHTGPNSVRQPLPTPQLWVLSAGCSSNHHLVLLRIYSLESYISPPHTRPCSCDLTGRGCGYVLLYFLFAIHTISVTHSS